MKKTYFFTAFYITLCLCCMPTFGQVYPLGLEEMFQLAEENNLHLKEQSAAVAGARAEVKAAQNAYLPSLTLNASASYNGDGTITDRDFSHRFRADIPSFGNNFALEAVQVIFAGGGVKNTVKSAQLKAQLAELNLQNNREKIHFLIVGNYLQMQNLQNQLKIFDGHIAQTEQMLENMRQRYREGVALRNDITRYELQLQNLQYAQIELSNTLRILNSQLLSALGLQENSQIVPQKLDLPAEAKEQTESQWQEIALHSSQELKLAHTDILLQQQAEKLARSERWPQVFLFASNRLDGPILIEIPALDKNFNYWTVGIGINYRLDSLYKTARHLRAREQSVLHSRAQYAQTQEDLRLSVHAAYIRWQEAFTLLETKKKSVELAQRNYDTVSYRYENGLVLITDLLDASAQQLDARLQAANAEVNITYNYYKLRYLAGIL